jgi:hypothetical protein
MPILYIFSHIFRTSFAENLNPGGRRASSVEASCTPSTCDSQVGSAQTLTPTEQLTLIQQLGARALFSAASPWMQYELQLSRREDEDVAFLLCNMASRGDGWPCLQRLAINSQVASLLAPLVLASVDHGCTHAHTPAGRPPGCDSQRRILSKSWEKVTSPKKL